MSATLADLSRLVTSVDAIRSRSGVARDLGQQLTADAAAELGMPPGTTQGHAAAELLLAVNDTAGPRCRSYRSALRDHDDTFVSQ